jgi:hypothetical protein
MKYIDSLVRYLGESGLALPTDTDTDSMNTGQTTLQCAAQEADNTSQPSFANNIRKRSLLIKI